MDPVRDKLEYSVFPLDDCVRLPYHHQIHANVIVLKEKDCQRKNIANREK